MLSLRGGLFLRRDNMQEKEAMNRLLETLIESVQATSIKLQGLEAWLNNVLTASTKPYGYDSINYPQAHLAGARSYLELLKEIQSVNSEHLHRLKKEAK